MTEKTSLWQRIKNHFKKSPNSDDAPKRTVVIVTNDNNVPNNRPRVDKMSDFSKVLVASDIILDVDASSKIELLKYIAKFAHETDSKIDSEVLYGKLIMRENQASTQMGGGVVMPHAMDSSISKLRAIILKLKNPIVWAQGEKVDVVVSLLIPDPEKDYQHVPYMSTLARLMLKKDFLKSLKQAKSSEAVLRLFS